MLKQACRFILAALVALAATGAAAQDAALHDIDIPAQALSASIVELSRQASVQIYADGALVSGVSAPAVSGRLTGEQALGKLLQGSGLVPARAGTGLVVKKGEPRSDNDQQLPEVSVESSQDNDSPIGPDAGYTAKRSLAGTKTDTPLVETPQSISVVTRATMDDLGAQTVDDTLRYSAGVRTGAQGYSPLWDIYTVRGFQQSNASIFRDGMRPQMWNGDGRVETYGLERVEVLRGPASILYGSAAPGGVINGVSKRPTAERLREIEVQAGSYDRLQGAFDLSGPVDDGGALLYRLTGLARDSDTQIDYVPDNRTYLAPALTWRIGADTSLTLLGEYQRNESMYTRDLPAQGTVLPNPNGKVPTNRFLDEPDDYYDSESQAGGYLAEHRVNDAWKLRQNLRLNRYTVDQRNVQGLSLQPDLRTIDPFASAANSTTNSLTVDTSAEVAWKTGDLGHVTLFGVDYRKFEYEDQGRVGTTTTIDLFNPVYGRTVTFNAAPDWHYRQEQSQVGYYVQEQASYGNWRVLLGGRKDLVRDNFQDLISPTSQPSNERESAFTGRVGVVYLSDSGLAPYASYTESFEPQTGASFNLQPFDPSTGKQYEIGVRYQPPGSNAMVTVSAFDLVRQNVLTPDPVNPGLSIQTGEITSRGVEVEATASLRNGLDLVAAFTWNDVEVTESNDLDLGKRPTQVPETMASFWAVYRMKGALAGWRAGGGVRYVGATAGDFTNTFDVPEFTLFDALLGYDHQSWSLAFNAANLFDKEYVAGCWGMNGCSYGARRTLAATVKYRF